MREFPAPGRSHLPQRKRGKVIPMPIPRVVHRRRNVRIAMASLGVLLVAAIGGRVYLITQRPLSSEQLAAVDPQEAKILELVNGKRAKSGLAPLKLSARLTVAARGHSYDMALRGYFSHQSADGVGPGERIRGSGIQYAQMGENIYEDDLPDRRQLPERAIQAWMQSPRHRQNLLSPRFSETGIGAARAADGATYITEDFVQKSRKDGVH
jgi:uncharacterized protein YkwD